MIFLKVDVTKIDKARLFNGEKGTYLDMVLIETPNSQYADYMIKQSVTKEEREQGIEIVLGDGKIYKRQDPTNDNTPPDVTIDNSNDDGLPF